MAEAQLWGGDPELLLLLRFPLLDLWGCNPLPFGSVVISSRGETLLAPSLTRIMFLLLFMIWQTPDYLPIVKSGGLGNLSHQEQLEGLRAKLLWHVHFLAFPSVEHI